MGNTDINEMNRVIAGFMGFLTVDGRNYVDWDGLHDVKYHSSWDWLMPVVDDIKYSRRGINYFPKNEVSNKGYIIYGMIEEAILNLSIEQTHAATYYFIRWYNQNKPTI